MLQLLGLLLKAFITIAIGMMGFTWEPKEDIRVPEKKEKHGELLLPVRLNAPMAVPARIEAKAIGQHSNCADTAHTAVFPFAPIQPLKPGLSI